MKTYLSICLDKKGGEPIYKQLGDALLELISDGILKPDSKLPPIRKMAESLKINSSTVVNAYRYLETRNAVYSFLGSGTYVAPIMEKPVQLPYNKPVICGVSEADIIADFSSTRTPERLFPEKKIKNAFSSIIDTEKGGIFAETGENALKPFIEVIAGRIKEYGINAQEGIITNGLAEAFELVTDSIIKKGDYVVLEKPSAFSRTGPYLERGAKILYAPLCADGMDLDAFEMILKTYRPKAAHVSTYFQTPTNITYSLNNKKTLLELCYKYGVIIVEEDMYSELEQNEKKIFLKSIDYKGSVVFIKSLTKTHFPWFNLNFCVFPKKNRICHEKLARYSQNAVIQAKLLNKMIISGAYDATATKIIKYIKESHEFMSEEIKAQLSGMIEYINDSVGAGFWLKIQTNAGNDLAKKCAMRGVIIIPGSIYMDENNYVRLCIPDAEPEKIRNGIRVVKEELTKLINR